ncbi:MAG: 5'-nucleotidase C-terminal domain-containing protein [Actinomycetia bacterium]|nr:5'-nucleotidase C-terminal domain-containing protein [Actinomycetes bacterium]
MLTRRSAFLIVAMVLALIIPTAALAGPKEKPAGSTAEVTVLHTNDFHGRLETDYKYRGGSAYMASIINDIRAEVGEENVALVDAGDVYFAAPAISQLLMGESTIDIYNMMGYDLAAFGNHEFDKGQEELAIRVAQSEFPWLGANVVLEGTEWDLPEWASPYEILDVGGAKLGVLGLAGQETPEVTLIGTTAGLEFKDLAETILHYYDEILAEADAMIVVAHMGTEDSGPYEGLETVAQKLIDAGKPVDLMIGGHQHQALFEPVMVGDTAIVAAGYYGRWLGRLDLTIDKTAKQVEISHYELITVTGAPTYDDLAAGFEELFDGDAITNAGVYNSLMKKLQGVLDALAKDNLKLAQNKLQALANELAAQAGKNVEADIATELAEAIESYLAHPADPDVEAQIAYWAEIVAPIVNQPVGATNVDLVRDYNHESNMGDLVTDSMRWSADWYDDGELNGSVDIAFTNPGGMRADILTLGATPYTITWGDTFEVLPFGNTLYLMDLTGAQIQDLADQSALLYKGILQTSGASYYWYNDTGGDDATAWGAYGIEVGGEPLVRDEVYRVVTNNFLAGGQDGWTTFADGTNRWDTYYDMQEGFVEYIKTFDVIDAEDIPMDRIVRLDDVVTMLHTNDTHGRWPADSYYGSPQGFEHLASLIEAERAHNPDALLLDAGDTFQGNSFAYFFKDRLDNPIAGGMNLLDYDAMVIGNHEFNFGPTTFDTMLSQVEFPLLGTANMDDDGSYGFINDNVDDYINLDVNGRKVTIFGLTNPRIHRYELPTNIPGMTFYSAWETAQSLVPTIIAAEDPDLLVGLTHVGFAPYGGEDDSDLLIAENVAGIDVIVGGHSHTRLNPATMVTSDINTGGTLIAHAQKYALWLGKVNVGFIGDEIVLREGYLIPAGEAETDPAMVAYLAPYVTEIDTYNATEIGSTLVPIDALEAYTQETNGANLQADSAVAELASHGITVDMHLSGAMSNKLVAAGATPATPVPLTKGDMFNLMPYENSLVVLSMNGPQIKEILERSYRNYWYYKYDEGYGGYSHYTTCMLATDAGNVIEYSDPGELVPPDGNNVLEMTLEGVPVDFTDDTTFYSVSTVNYVAAGSCNFNNDGETIWPLSQISHDTQYYVRDTVINYVEAQVGPISPAIEGRLVFTDS